MNQPPHDPHLIGGAPRISDSGESPKPAAADTPPPDPAVQEQTQSQFPAEGDATATLESVIVLYERAVAGGAAPDQAAWLARYPHMRDALQAYFSNQEHLRRAFRPFQAPSGKAPAPLPDVPGYEVRSELGRGGMGVVYLARDLSLPRFVALKMIRAGAPLTADQRSHFRAEAEAVARLQHPHIVQIHAVGEFQGQPFLALEYLPGGSLDRQIGDAPQPPAAAAHLVEILARAVHAAHQGDIIHRDLKPANVLLAPANPGDPGGTPYGLPKVSDFGLAKHLDPTRPRAPEEGVVGTACYMAPEQAAGQHDRVGPATDVYALGVILYEMLTGRRPFQADTIQETLKQVRTEPPAPPRAVNPDVPAELEAICLRCLAKQPAGRYPTAAELAADLHRYRTRAEGPNPAPTLPAPHAETTHPPSLRRRWRWAVVLGLSAAVLIGLVVLMNRPWNPDTQPSRANPPVPIPDANPPWKGDIDVEVWDPKNPDRRGRLHTPGVLPVRVGDVVIIKAEANRPAYLYVVWIDAAGTAAPLYPWEDYDWAKRPQTEKKRSRLTLFDDPKYQWELRDGTTGMDALLLLVRDTPLTAAGNQQLRALVEGLGAQKAPRLQTAAWFEKGELQRDDPDRSVPVKQLRKDDPVLQTQALLRTRLAEIFPYTRAVVFAFDGREK
jgi:serine/threonine protein kinase